jgi:hypothetical protein
VGGMLVGPIIMLVVVPALQTLFLAREGGPRSELEEAGDGIAEAET